MAWTDQNPQATDVLLSCHITRGQRSVWFEVDKLPDDVYRATYGNLFGSHELMRSKNLEQILRAISDTRR